MVYLLVILLVFLVLMVPACLLSWLMVRGDMPDDMPDSD